MQRRCGAARGGAADQFCTRVAVNSRRGLQVVAPARVPGGLQSRPQVSRRHVRHGHGQVNRPRSRAAHRLSGRPAQRPARRPSCAWGRRARHGCTRGVVAHSSWNRRKCWACWPRGQRRAAQDAAHAAGHGREGREAGARGQGGLRVGGHSMRAARPARPRPPVDCACPAAPVLAAWRVPTCPHACLRARVGSHRRPCARAARAWGSRGPGAGHAHPVQVGHAHAAQGVGSCLGGTRMRGPRCMASCNTHPQARTVLLYHVHARAAPPAGPSRRCSWLTSAWQTRRCCGRCSGSSTA